VVYWDWKLSNESVSIPPKASTKGPKDQMQITLLIIVRAFALNINKQVLLHILFDVSQYSHSDIYPALPFFSFIIKTILASKAFYHSRKWSIVEPSLWG